MNQRHLRQTTNVFYEGNHEENMSLRRNKFFLYWVNHLESPLKFTFLHSCTKNSIFVLIKDNRVFSCSFQPNKAHAGFQITMSPSSVRLSVNFFLHFWLYILQIPVSLKMIKNLFKWTWWTTPSSKCFKYSKIVAK